MPIIVSLKKQSIGFPASNRVIVFDAYQKHQISNQRCYAMNVLHIDSGILGDHSVSRRLTAAITAGVVSNHAGAKVIYRDLVADPLPHLTGAHLTAANAKPEDLDSQVFADVAVGAAVLEEFLAADTVIIGAPMYNFALPSQLKAWIDASPSLGRRSATPKTARKGWRRARRSSLRPPAVAITAPARRP